MPVGNLSPLTIRCRAGVSVPVGGGGGGGVVAETVMGRLPGDRLAGSADLGLPFGHAGHQPVRVHRGDVLIGGAPGKSGAGDGGAAGVLCRRGELECLADLQRRGGTGDRYGGDRVGRLDAAAITVAATFRQCEQQHGEEGEQSGTATRECLGHKQLLFDAAQRVKIGTSRIPEATLDYGSRRRRGEGQLCRSGPRV